MKHQPLVFVDIETTGGRTDTTRITDIGMIRVENGKVVRTINQLINPERPIPGYITDLTGITNDMVWSAPTFKTVAPDIESILDGAIFIAHHVKFDYGIMKREFKDIGVTFNMTRACSVKLSRLLDPQHKRHGLDFIIERMGLNVKNRHRGYDDAEVLWRYFKYKYEVCGNLLYLSLAAVTTSVRLRTKTNAQVLLL